MDKYNKRFSGIDYTNSDEKLDEIREKYSSGVTDEMVTELADRLAVAITTYDAGDTK